MIPNIFSLLGESIVGKHIAKGIIFSNSPKKFHPNGSRIQEQFKDKINGTFAFFDRMIIKGHIRQFFSASGKGFFLSEQNVLLKDFSAYANQVTSDIVAHVEKMAEETHRPLRYLTSAKIPKEQTAMEILKDDPVEEGLVCILSVVEYCQTLQPIKNKDGKLELRNVDRKCKYYYLS